LQHVNPIAHQKGDEEESRKRYYASLEKAQIQEDNSDFIQLIVEVVKEPLEKDLSALK